MRPRSPDAFIIRPTPLTRELLAEVLRARLGIHCSGMAGSIAGWPATSTAQLLLLEGDAARVVDGSIAALEASPAGVRGVRIDSSAGIEAVIDAVRGAMRVAPTSLEKLTPQETQVLLAVAAGERNVEIARRHRRSVKTVEKHRANVHRKLGVRTTAQLTAYAIRAGLLDLDMILRPRRGS